MFTETSPNRVKLIFQNGKDKLPINYEEAAIANRLFNLMNLDEEHAEMTDALVVSCVN